MSSFGNDIVCKNIQCDTVNGQTYNPVQTLKWTETNNVLEPATAGASVKISGLEVDGNAEIIGKTELIAKLGSQTILYLGGPRENSSTYIDVNTAQIDIDNAATIYLVQMQKKPDRSENQFFRINMSGDIIGCNDIDCNKLTTKTLRYEKTEFG